MNTKTQRSPHRGWMTESHVEINDTMRLRILTMKRWGGSLCTTATVEHKDGNYFYYEPFKDYDKTILSTRPARVTQRTVEEQHAQATRNLDAIRDTIDHHYSLTH